MKLRPVRAKVHRCLLPTISFRSPVTWWELTSSSLATGSFIVLSTTLKTKVGVVLNVPLIPMRSAYWLALSSLVILSDDKIFWAALHRDFYRQFLKWEVSFLSTAAVIKHFYPLCNAWLPCFLHGIKLKYVTLSKRNCWTPPIEWRVEWGIL